MPIDYREVMRLCKVGRRGDALELLAKPIAKILKLDCLDAEGKLKPESGCQKRRDALNKVKTPVDKQA